MYEDEEILVVKKPAGIATQTKKLAAEDMESILKNYRAAKKEEPYIGVVHRLDQPVSGVMVFAKNKKAAAELSRQFQTKQADKFYYAVTDGVPDKEKDSLCNFLLKDTKGNTSKVVTEKMPGAKQAKLNYEVMEQNENRALLKIALETGRHHQIRVQLSYAGWPIVGDRKYNRKETITPSGESLKLCSFQLGFLHPKTRKKMDFEIDKPFHLT